MAISGLNGVIAGMRPPFSFQKSPGASDAAGYMVSTLFFAGNPGSYAMPVVALSGLPLYAGSGISIPYPDPGAGSNAYLARFSAAANVQGTLILADRLWHNAQIAPTGSTNAQTINSAQFPQRDNNGYHSGTNVLVALEVRTATTNAGARSGTTISYTNTAGTATRTGIIGTVAPDIFPATAVVGTFVPFNLQSGDDGVQSIQSITLGSSFAAGSIGLVAYRELTRIEVTSANVNTAVDAITSGFPRLYSGTVPFLIWMPITATATTLAGQIIYTHG